MGVTMRIRLYAFLLAVVFIMLLGIVFIFVVTGLLSADQTAAERFIEKEFSRLHRDLTLHIGDATVELVSLSQDLSRSIELQLLSRDIPVNELHNNPDVLEELIANELFRLQIAMERSRSSGIFMVLDATINPNLEYSEYSKAGLYLRDYEPRAVGAPEITWCFFRGFSSIAHQNGLLMQAGWELEFNVRDVDFYNVPMELGRDASLPLSRMYYWSNVSIIPELDESILKCSIPLIDSDGNPFGVCGFEISNWNFRLRFAPDDGDYPDALVLFGPITGENKLLRENILFSGKQRSPADHTALSLISTNGLGRYTSERGMEYYGLHREVRMYPADSPFAHERFALTLLIPKETIDAAVQSTNRTLAIISFTFLIAGVFVSIFVSNRYLKPIKSALDAMHSGSHDALGQTNIREIDELLDRLREMIVSILFVLWTAASIVSFGINNVRAKRSRAKGESAGYILTSLCNP